MTEKIKGVPPQKTGGHHDTESEKCFETEDEAKNKYEILRQRLLDFKSWHSYGGELSAEFILYNDRGEKVNRLPEIGDFVKIDIPGPGSVAGKGYDWVKITEIDEKPYDNDERCFIRCIPSINPTADYVEDIAHFYSDKASSNFVARRKGKCIYAEIHGRNEVSNSNTENFPDKIRNTLIALGGRAGVAKIQWKSLANGLLDF